MGSKGPWLIVVRTERPLVFWRTERPLGFLGFSWEQRCMDRTALSVSQDLTASQVGTFSFGTCRLDVLGL